MSLSDFTLSERDRRWNLVRKEMEKRGLSCLVIYPNRPLGNNFGEWLCNDVSILALIFPLDGDPTALISPAQRQYDIPLVRELGSVWVSDYWLAPVTSEGVIQYMRERGLENSKIGVTGIGERSRERAERSPEGIIPYGAWSNIVKSLPKATFEDIGWWMTEIVLPKSEEELKIVRRTADVAEEACYAIMDVAKPGVRENEIYAAATDTAIREGAPIFLFSLKSGPATLAASQPLWLQRGVPPRVIRAGDIITTEMGTHIGYYQAQVQFCLALEPVDKLHIKLNEIDQEIIQASLDTLRPGRNFSEVNEATDAPLRKARAFTTSPNIHSMNPQVLRTIHALDYATGKPVTKERTNARVLEEPGSIKYITGVRGPDVVIKKGMVFELEPGACLEDHRVLVGGTVVVGDDKPILYNHLPLEMQRI